MRYESLVSGPHTPPQGPYPKPFTLRQPHPVPRGAGTRVLRGIQVPEERGSFPALNVYLRPSPLPTRTSGHPEASAKATDVLLTQVATQRDALLEGCLAAGPHPSELARMNLSFSRHLHICTRRHVLSLRNDDVPGCQEVQCERDRVSIALHNQPNHACPGRAQTSNLGLLHRARSRLFENLAPSLSIHIPDVHEHYPKPILALTIKTLPPKRVPRRVLYQPAGHLPNTTCRV